MELILDIHKKLQIMDKFSEGALDYKALCRTRLDKSVWNRFAFTRRVSGRIA